MPELKIYRSREQLPGTAGGVAVPTGIGDRPFEAAQGLISQAQGLVGDVQAGQEKLRRERVALETVETVNTYRSALSKKRQELTRAEGMQVLRFEQDENGNPLSISQSYGKAAGKYQEDIKFSPDMSENEKRALKLELERIYQNTTGEVADWEFKQKQSAGIAQLKVTQDELVKSAAEKAEIAPGLYPSEELEQAAGTIELLKENGFMSEADAEEYMMVMDKAIITGSMNRVLLANPEAVAFLMEDEAGEPWREALTADEITEYKKAAKDQGKIKAKSDINRAIVNGDYNRASTLVEENADKLKGGEVKQFRDIIKDERAEAAERDIAVTLLDGDTEGAMMLLRDMDATRSISPGNIVAWKTRIEEGDKNESNLLYADLNEQISSARTEKEIKAIRNEISTAFRNREISQAEYKSLWSKTETESSKSPKITSTKSQVLQRLKNDLKEHKKIFGENTQEQDSNYLAVVAAVEEYADEEGRTPQEIQQFYVDIMKPYKEAGWIFDSMVQSPARRVREKSAIPEGATIVEGARSENGNRVWTKDGKYYEE